MPKNFFLINKKEGETPLEALEVFRNKNKISKNIPMTYAGRLDPMASGVLILLVGEECKNKDKYLNLDKEYEFQVLFGFATDTYDILGKVISTKGNPSEINDLDKLIKKNIKNFKGKRIQKYPIYSSKTVEGKPLFSYAREGKEIEIPEREVYIKSLNYLGLKKISAKSLLNKINTRVGKVKGDFRQKEILKLWDKNLNLNNSFYIADFKVKCTSGTYVRTIANDLGENIGIPALAYSINRIKVGRYAKI